MKNKLYFSLGLSIAVGGICLLLIGKNDDRTPVLELENNAAPRNINAASKIKRLKRTVKLSSQLVSKVFDGETYEDEADSIGPSEPRVPDQSMTRIALMKKEIGDKFFQSAPTAFDEILDEEPINPVWTDMVKSGIDDIIVSNELENLKMEEVHCHRTLCKIVIRFDDSETERTYKEARSKNEALMGPDHGFSSLNDDGSRTSKFYMGRRGYEFSVQKAVVERMYELVTGKSVNSVVPTAEQIAQVARFRSGGKR